MMTSIYLLLYIYIFSYSILIVKSPLWQLVYGDLQIVLLNWIEFNNHGLAQKLCWKINIQKPNYVRMRSKYNLL